MQRSIEATRPLRAGVENARETLLANPESVFGTPQPTERRLRSRRFKTTMPAALGSGGSIEKEVVLGIGRVPPSPQDLVVELTWDPTGRNHVLPAFCGELLLSPSAGRGSEAGRGSDLTISGTYCAPFGPIGRFGDAVIGHRVARGSLDLFVGRLADRFDKEAIRRRQALVLKPAPYNDDLRPHSRSEDHIG